MKILMLILVIILSKTVFLLSLMEVTKRNEASEHRIAALNEVVAHLTSDSPATGSELSKLEDEVKKHRSGPQVIPYNFSVGSYMLIIPTSFWVFITSIRTAVKKLRKPKT